MRRKDREVSDIGEICSIIDKCKVCHLAMVDKGRPYVVPLSFGYRIDGAELTVYFHSANEGRKIDILREKGEVCFEMTVEGKLSLGDNPCNSGYYYESVIGFGQVEFVEDSNEKCEALTLMMKQQANQSIAFTKKQADSVCVFKLVSGDFIGKKKPEPNRVG